MVGVGIEVDCKVNVVAEETFDEDFCEGIILVGGCG